MSQRVRCTQCGRVYDLGSVTVIGRYSDCSVWKCPGCKITVDDRPVGWGAHHYVELPSDPPGFGMTATCSICGKRWDARDPGITRWWGTDEWNCTDEALCFDRAAMNLITTERA